MPITLPILIVLGLLLAWVWAFYAMQRLAIRQQVEPQAPSNYPTLTVIRPIKGVDTGLRENVIAGFEDEYPGALETLFVFDDDEDPAVRIVREVIEERKAQGLFAEAEILFSGQPPRNRTGKLNAMIQAMASAHHTLIAFVDSDIRQTPGDLVRLVATLLSDDGAGSAFPTVVSSATPHTLGDVGYAVMVNGLYEPSALATARRANGTLPFIMGHMMVLRREAIDAIGGLETAEGQLVDDMYLGKRMVEEGFRNLLSPKPVSIIQQDCTFEEFVGILIRWIAFSMSGLPFWTTKLPHALTGFALWGGLIATGYGLYHGLMILVLFGLVTALSVPITINNLHFRMSKQPIPWRFAWGSMIIWLAAPMIYAQIWIRREVNWRGRRYRLNLQSRLS
jgi:ceramide glucosyltransferase